MAYSIDVNGDIVINGFPKGIGSDPYSGLTDLRSVNPISIPNEVSISFSTSSQFSAANVPAGTAGSVTTSTNFFVAPLSLKIETFQWIIFDSITTGGTNLSTSTPYFLIYSATNGLNAEYVIYTSYPTGSAVTVGANSNVTFHTIVPGLPKYFDKSNSYNFMLDANGRVWSDLLLTTGGGIIASTSSWSYISNSTDSTSNGNGLLVFTTVHNATGGNSGTPPSFDQWLFVWRNSQIDYTQLSSGGSLSTIAWVNGWNYKLTSGTTTGYTGYLNTQTTVNNPHPALVTPDSRANFLDGNFIGNFYQNIPSGTGSYDGFNPATGGTWAFSTITAVLPAFEVGQSLNFVNEYLLIGATKNIVYPWNLSPASNTYSTPLILLPENNTTQIITVGNNAYLFTGNRGNIYITNGSQASLFKKVPDYLGGAVEPLFSWGGAAYNKNRLYFGIQSNLQSGGNGMNYGGLWCIDLDTGALWNSNQMSYGTYNGYVSALGVSSSGGATYNPSIGYGLIMGWSDGATPTYGIDASIAKPYSGGQSYVVSDLIPVGTLLNPMTAYEVEYKLAMPLLSGESVKLTMGSSLADYTNNTMTSVFTTSGDGLLVSDNSSNHSGIPIQKQQWLLLKAILTAATGGTPSYNRITELRVIGDTIRTNVPGQPFGIQ